MRKNSRFLSLLLCICMVFSCIVVSADEAATEAETEITSTVFTDIKGTESYANAIYVLSAFGLIKGYQDGSFGPDGNITRAEFATMLVRALGQEDAALASAGATEFTDVAADFWGSGYINIASGLKIINGYGDGTFGPDNNVTYEQAVKMVVCALGYEPLANESVTAPVAVWPMGYINAAGTIKILDGVNGEMEKPMTRWQVAQLIYNSLEVNLMEQVIYNDNYGYQISDTKTLLYTKLGLYKSTGELLADEDSSILESGNLARKGQIIVDDDNIGEQIILNNEKDLDTSTMVGHPVEFYYEIEFNGDYTLVYIMDKIKSNNVLTIDADQIESSSGTLHSGLTIYYYENEGDRRTQSIKLVSDPTVIKNGKYIEDPTEEDILPYSGSVEVISSTNSDSYDRVIVTSYETWVINSVNKTTKTIVDMYRGSGSNTFVIDEEDPMITLSMARTDGTSVTINNLAKWQVLSIAETQGTSRKQLMNIVVSTKSKVGTVTQVDDEDYIYIDGEPYEVSQYFLDYGDVEFSVDDYGTFYFDKDDKISAFDQAASSDTNYGYIKEVEYDRSEGRLQLAILPQSSTDLTTEFYSSKKLKIDGVSGISASSAYDILREVIDRDVTADAEYTNIDTSNTDSFDEGLVCQLVKYTLNSVSGEITEIDTIAENSTVRDSDLTVKTGIDYDTNTDGHKVMTYNSSTKTFTGASSTDRFRISTSTYVFMVPNDRNEDEEYVRKTYAYFSNAKEYTVEAYNVDSSTNIAEAVVVYGAISDRFITDTSPLAFVMSNTSKANASDSDYNRYLTAYCFGKDITDFTSQKILWGESSAVSDFKPGDIIRYTTTSKGYINSDTVTRVFSIAEDADYDERVVNDIMNSTDETKAPYQVFSGLLYSAAQDGNNWYIDIANTDSIDEVEDSDIETFAITSNYAQIFEYDAEESDEITKHTYSEFDFTGLESYTETNATSATEIFVYALDGNVRLVYIVTNR